MFCYLKKEFYRLLQIFFSLFFCQPLLAGPKKLLCENIPTEIRRQGVSFESFDEAFLMNLPKNRNTHFKNRMLDTAMMVCFGRDLSVPSLLTLENVEFKVIVKKCDFDDLKKFLREHEGGFLSQVYDNFFSVDDKENIELKIKNFINGSPIKIFSIYENSVLVGMCSAYFTFNGVVEMFDLFVKPCGNQLTLKQYIIEQVCEYTKDYGFKIAVFWVLKSSSNCFFNERFIEALKFTKLLDIKEY